MARRRFGRPGTTRIVFSALWIALGGLSAYYLFTLFTGAAPAVSRTAQMAAPAAPEPAAQAPSPSVAPGLSAEQLSVIDKNLQTLSQQLATLDERLRPIENFIGPAAKLPPANSVSTSAPRPLPKLEPLPRVAAVSPAPEPKPAPAPETAAAPATPEPPAAPAAPETPAPAAAAPPEPPEPAQEAAPQPSNPPAAAPKPPKPVATTPPPAPRPAAAPPATPAAPAAPATATATPPGAEIEPEVAAEEVEIAAIDPVALPPAANDGSTRYGIEIGSVAKRDELRPLWREYLTKHAALVAGLQPRRVRAPDNRWRLIAGPFDNAQDAEGACSLFKRAERPCAATVYAGDAL